MTLTVKLYLHENVTVTFMTFDNAFRSAVESKSNRAGDHRISVVRNVGRCVSVRLSVKLECSIETVKNIIKLFIGKLVASLFFEPKRR